MNPLDYITTTNYPTSFLQNTFGNQYFKNVVEPTKAAIQSGSTASKPALGQLIKNWNPLKAFTPQMLATGPTRAASTFLKSTGIGTLASMLLNPTVANADEVEWEKQLMRNISMRDRRATQQGIAQVAMQKRIQEAEAAAIIAAQKDGGGGGGAGGPNVPGTPIVPVVPTPSYSKSYNPGAGGVVTHTPISTPASTVPGPQAYHQPSSGGGGGAASRAGGGSRQAQSGGASPGGGWGGGWGWSRGGRINYINGGIARILPMSYTRMRS